MHYYYFKMLAATAVVLLLNLIILDHLGAHGNASLIAVDKIPNEHDDNGLQSDTPKAAIKEVEVEEIQIIEPTIPEKKERVPVKLNMKQALIMNQVVMIYALTRSENELCRNHSKEFQEALRAFEPWALQMFDSTTKLESGILAGNFMEYGSFRQCINIDVNTEVGQIKGKQCLIRLKPNEKIIKKILSYRNISERRYEHSKSNLEDSEVMWSVCIPESCSYKDVHEHFGKTIETITEGLNLTISTSEGDCYSKSDEDKPYSRKEKIVLIFLAALLLIILLCTIIDVYKRANNERAAKVAEIISAYSNAVFIMKTKNEEYGLDCLHGVRFLSMSYVVIGHRYLMALFFPSVNSLDILDWLLTYPSTFITGATISVDSFFLMGGILVSYYFFDYMSKGGKFNLFAFYLHRFLRLTPPCAVLVLIIATLSHRFGSGPQWKEISNYLQEPCQKYWWSLLLHIQNYVNPDNMCIIQTWYLSCEMQFFLLSPIFMYPLWKSRKLGIINLIFFYTLTTSMNFYLAWKNEYKADMLIANNLPQTDFFAYHYTMPHVRGGPYIMGVGFGYLLFVTRGMKIKMGTYTLIAGWLVSASTMATIILSNHRFEIESYEYNKLEVCIYLAFTRSAWAASLMWVIWVCRAGYGGPVNTILTANAFQSFGKISYSIFLVHMPIQYLSNGASKLPMYFSNFASIHKALGDIALSLFVAFFLTIFVENPGVRLSLLLFSSFRKKTGPKDQNEDDTKVQKITVKEK